MATRTHVGMWQRIWMSTMQRLRDVKKKHPKGVTATLLLEQQVQKLLIFIIKHLCYPITHSYEQ